MMGFGYRLYPSYEPEIDGGVKVDNIRAIKAAGADTFVTGSSIFSQPDYKKVIDEMRAELALTV
jgi:ribulose-phosphate 3-epimerase